MGLLYFLTSLAATDSHLVALSIVSCTGIMGLLTFISAFTFEIIITLCSPVLIFGVQTALLSYLISCYLWVVPNHKRFEPPHLWLLIYCPDTDSYLTKSTSCMDYRATYISIPL